jgi:hypothetical protein
MSFELFTTPKIFMPRLRDEKCNLFWADWLHLDLFVGP